MFATRMMRQVVSHLGPEREAGFETKVDIRRANWRWSRWLSDLTERAAWVYTHRLHQEHIL